MGNWKNVTPDGLCPRCTASARSDSEVESKLAAMQAAEKEAAMKAAKIKAAGEVAKAKAAAAEKARFYDDGLPKGYFKLSTEKWPNTYMFARKGENLAGEKWCCGTSAWQDCKGGAEWKLTPVEGFAKVSGESHYMLSTKSMPNSYVVVGDSGQGYLGCVDNLRPTDKNTFVFKKAAGNKGYHMYCVKWQLHPVYMCSSWTGSVCASEKCSKRAGVPDSSWASMATWILQPNMEEPVDLM